MRLGKVETTVSLSHHRLRWFNESHTYTNTSELGEFEASLCSGTGQRTGRDICLVGENPARHLRGSGEFSVREVAGAEY